MKKLFKAMAVVAVISLTSCTTFSPTAAGLFSDVTQGVTATSNSVGTKVGKSSASNVLGIVATGDASINEAAKQGGIKKISHVDQRTFSVLGLFTTITTFVYGE